MRVKLEIYNLKIRKIWYCKMVMPNKRRFTIATCREIVFSTAFPNWNALLAKLSSHTIVCMTVILLITKYLYIHRIYAKIRIY